MGKPTTPVTLLLRRTTVTCPTEETLALFAAGQLDPEARNAVLAHIATCNDCMSAVLAANAHLAEESTGTGSNWWIGAVAAAVIIAVVLAFPMLQRRNDPVRTLVAAAPASE